MIREVRIESVVVRVDPSSESGFARSPTVWLLGVFTFPGTFWCSSPCFTILNEKVLSFPPFSEKVEYRSWENLMKNWWKWIYRRELNLQLHPICDPTNPAFHVLQTNWDNSEDLKKVRVWVWQHWCIPAPVHFSAEAVCLWQDDKSPPRSSKICNTRCIVRFAHRQLLLTRFVGLSNQTRNNLTSFNLNI